MDQERNFKKVLTIALILLLAAPLVAARREDQPSGPPTRLAEEQFQGSLISWQPNLPFEQIRLVVSGNDGVVFEEDFEAGFPLVFELIDQQGKGLGDGQYRYELRATPLLGAGVRELIAMARESGDTTIVKELRESGVLPDPDALVLAGTFRILDGSLVDPGIPEETDRKGGGPGSRYLQGSSATPQDFVINDDLIVDGSACIGFDCVNGEVFSFDTIRLKENNLRIKADDTSVVPSFPANDWQLTFNESANGGASKFSVEDISGGRTPFTIEANARSHSLYVDDGGRIGSRTSTPSVEIHTIDGDTPTLRLQQDGSSGFEPQTWDVAGNETNFFIRDVTNGSALPFRIRPSAPSNAIFIDVDGDVGLNSSSPTASLYVRRTNNSAKLIVEETNTTDQDLTMAEFINAHGAVTIRLNDDDNGGADQASWDFQASNGGFNITKSGTGGAEIRITPGEATVFRFGEGGASDFTMDGSGNATFAGNVNKAGGTFIIDHPLDPANKYLRHSYVESPDMMNIYNGNAVLDDEGEAEVTLPDWFEVLNSDYRYQLTSIGAPNPNLYIARKISGNHFKIAGGTPGSEVSWQVTGVRQDAWAKANRIQVEEMKPAAKRGSYLHPELFQDDKTQRAEKGAAKAEKAKEEKRK